MPRALASVLTTATLLVATSAPALAEPADADSDRARAAAERALDRSGRLRWMGTLGAGLSIAAVFMTDEQMASGGGVALATGGLATLGLGVIGDVAKYRARTRLDALDRISAGGLDSPARAEAAEALRRGRQFRMIGEVGGLMFVAMPFFPSGHRCGWGENTPGCSPAAKAYLVGASAAVGLGIAGLIKTSRVESRLEALDERPQASHRFGVAPLRDGVAANYSVAW